eukprot:914449-Prorocentrum_minimum.AAC.1
MDFKVAGTAEGITGVQLDIKPAGVPLPVMGPTLIGPMSLMYVSCAIPGPGCASHLEKRLNE